MNKQLLKDLAELEAQQVITAETSERIRSFYEHRQQGTSNRGGIILAILGALLAGGGLILIIAHNWDEFTKVTKTIIGLLPLLAAQALAAYTLAKQKHSKAWRECSGILLFLAIPSTISVISQVYQIEGDLAGFLLSWTLIALPIVYILSSSVVALLCIGTATWYATLTGYFEWPSTRPYLYLVMILFLAPHYYTLLKSKPRSNEMLLTNFFVCISIAIVFGSFIKVDDQYYPFVFALYLLLFCVYWSISSVIKAAALTLNRLPFRVTGLTGILGIFFMWSFESLWERLWIVWSNKFFLTPYPYLALVSLGFVIFLIRKALNEKKVWYREFVAFSFIVYLIAVLVFAKQPAFGMLIINLWILLVAVMYIRQGSRENNFGVLNFGLIILAVLALCRFFDDSVPFVWRGIFFLLTGIAFFVLNYLVMNRKKALNKSL
jgi:uncharacterized membrane protein